MESERIFLHLRHYHVPWTKIIDSYLIPVAALIVVITSTLVVFVYYKECRSTKQRIRNVTCIMYISIAIANVTAVIPKSVLYLYAFNYENVTHLIPFHLCASWLYINEFSKMPHCFSILLVAFLSLQRYQILCNPFKGAQIWRIRKTILIMVVFLLITLSLHFPSFFIIKLEKKEVNCDDMNSNDTFSTCSIYYKEWLNGCGVKISIIIMALKSMLIFLPSAVIMIYSDVSLILYLRTVHKVHKAMTNVVKRRNSKRVEYKFRLEPADSHQHKPQILLIVILSSVVFIVETPYFILMCVHIYFWSKSNYESSEWLWIELTRIIVDLSTFLSYPSLFIASCVTSKRFRKLLKDLFKSNRTFITKRRALSLDISSLQKNCR